MQHLAHGLAAAWLPVPRHSVRKSYGVRKAFGITIRYSVVVYY